MLRSRERKINGTSLTHTKSAASVPVAESAGRIFTGDEANPRSAGDSAEVIRVETDTAPDVRKPQIDVVQRIEKPRSATPTGNALNLLQSKAGLVGPSLWHKRAAS